MNAPISNLHEKMMASKMLTSAAGHASAELASFSGWLVTGFAAAFGLLLANIESVSKFIEPSSLASAIGLFLAAVVFHVLQRWLAAITAGSIAAGKESEQLGSASAEHAINFGVVFGEVERSTFKPARWFVRSAFQKVQAGDLVAGSRMQFKMAQFQALAVLLQLVLCVSAAAVVAFSLNV